MQGEQSEDSTRDIQDDQSLVMIQPKKYIMKHGAAEREDMHIMHDSPLGESQMEAHIEFVMDVQLPLGSAMGKEQTDVCVENHTTMMLYV